MSYKGERSSEEILQCFRNPLEGAVSRSEQQLNPYLCALDANRVLPVCSNSGVVAESPQPLDIFSSHGVRLRADL